MRRFYLIAASLLLALGAVEAVAYWWMHPAPTGLGEPVLVYRPGFSGQGTEDGGQEEPTSQSPSSNQQSKINNQQSSIFSPSSNQQSEINNRQSSISPSSTLTPLPEIYAKSAPMLRCSGGQVLHAKLDDSSGIHLAFFEWDGTDTGSVLEAFQHMPEACMGSIGLKLIEKAPSRTYVVGGQGTEDGGRETSDGGHETGEGEREAGGRVQNEASAQSSSSNQQSAINHLSVEACLTAEALAKEVAQSDHQSSISSPNQNSTSNIQNSKFATQSLVFDHTIFREGGGSSGLSAPIHAFRAVWVSGISMADARKGLAGDEFERLRTIRLKSAIDRFRPAHARVIQGAVRGIADPDLAWQAFEDNMLKDLSFQ